MDTIWNRREQSVPKTASNIYVSILPDMGTLIMVWEYPDKYSVWKTPPGVTLHDRDWLSVSEIAETGTVEWDDIWTRWKEISVQYGADFRGEREPQFDQYLKEHPRIAAFTDYRLGDKVSWRKGNNWVLGIVVGERKESSQMVLIEDDSGDKYMVPNKSLVSLRRDGDR